MQHNNSWAARNCRKASSSQSSVAIASTVECGCYNFWGSYVWYNNINVVADAVVGGAGAFGQLTVDRVRIQGDKKSQTEVQSLTRHLLKLKSFSNHQTKRIKLNVTRPHTQRVAHTLQYFSSELKRKREYDAAGLCTCWISKCLCVCVCNELQNGHKFQQCLYIICYRSCDSIIETQKFCPVVLFLVLFLAIDNSGSCSNFVSQKKMCVAWNCWHRDCRYWCCNILCCYVLKRIF